MTYETHILNLDVENGGNVPKFRRVVDAVNYAISEGRLRVGDMLPSVNQMCAEYGLSRDTVFKAFTMLKEQGTIESVPNKGYFVADQMKKVFVFLDTFKAYKEVLYDSFVRNLPKNVIADVNFHHYNPRIFKKLIEESIGKYTRYIVMPFEAEGNAEVLKLIPQDKLLIIDWNVYSGEGSSVLYQDFGRAFADGLADVKHFLKRYSAVHMLYPSYTNHPRESVEAFVQFCTDNGMKYDVEADADNFAVKAGVAYVSVSDRMLGRFLEQCRERKLEPGSDVGIISYNETPMKKFIYKGITVFSTDFEHMGRKAAQWVVEEEQMCECVGSRMIIRESL
jgi:DNA-binding transcriptional regulator YhcF (GntR family)